MSQETQERARQYLADQILILAVDIRRVSTNRESLREELGLAKNPAREVELAGAEMGIAVARMLSEGVIPMRFGVAVPDSEPHA